MLVLLTAAMSDGATPAFAMASRTHSQIRRQLRSVSKTWEPGTPGRAACAPLALADADLLAGLVEDDGAAAAGPQVDGQDVAHRTAAGSVRAARAARLATFCMGTPARKRSISAAAISPPWRSVSTVEPPRWGRITTLG